MNSQLALIALAAGKTVTIWNVTEASSTPINFWKGDGIGNGTTTSSLLVHRIDLSTN